MAKLIGGQRMVLQAVFDAQGDTTSYIPDTKIAETTRIAIKDVRDWLETLEGGEYVNVARTEEGLSASITANGRLALGQFRPFPSSTPNPAPLWTAKSSSSATGESGTSSHSTTEQPDAQPTGPRQPILLFYSYSHKDEALRDELAEALALLRRQGHISGWNDRAIVPGQEWSDQISEHLESARIILLLVSSSFLASDYCYGKEMERALEKHEAGEATVIPVIVRPCDWHEAPFAKLQGLPKDAKAVTSWGNKDEAWTDVAKGIRRAVETMRRHS